MKQRKIYLIREYTVLAVLFLFSIAALIGSIQIFQGSKSQDNPGMFPIVVCCGMIFCCLAAFLGVRKNTAFKAGETGDTETREAGGQGEGAAKEQEERGWAAVRLAAKTEVPFPVFILIAATILYGAVLTVAGFYLSTAVYMLFSILFLEKGKHVVRSVVVTGVWLVFVYLLIQIVFQIRLP